MSNRTSHSDGRSQADVCAMDMDGWKEKVESSFLMQLKQVYLTNL